MRLRAAAKNRLRVWGVVLWRPLSKGVLSVFGALGILTLIRDNLLPADLVAKFQILKYLPSWPLSVWLAVAFFCALVITLEGTYHLISELEGEVKEKQSRDEIVARLNELMRGGHQLNSRIEEYETPGVEPIFILEDEVERWVLEVYAYLKEALPQYSASFYRDFDTFREAIERRRTDNQERDRQLRDLIPFTKHYRQRLSRIVLAKIAFLEDLLGSL